MPPRGAGRGCPWTLSRTTTPPSIRRCGPSPSGWRNCSRAGLPELGPTLWHAQPVWLRGKHPVAGYKAFPRYVTLMLWVGPEFHDPAGVLQPAGNQNVVTVKYERVEDIHEDLIGGWLTQLG